MARFEAVFNETVNEFTAKFNEGVQSFPAQMNPVIKVYPDPYIGEYEVTPSEETQVLATVGMSMVDNVVVKPIPSNYGLITWNGSVLTVS